MLSNMKYLFLLMLTFAGLFPANASAEDGNAMIVETKGGNTVTFLFAQKPEMTFAGENVEIKSVDNTVAYPMADVLQVRFEYIPTGVAKVENGDLSFRFDGGKLEAEGLAPLSAVAVYSTDGAECVRGQADAGGRAVLAIGGLKPGVYVVKAGNVSYKIIKK